MLVKSGLTVTTWGPHITRGKLQSWWMMMMILLQGCISKCPMVWCLPGSHTSPPAWCPLVSPVASVSDGSEARPWHATIIPARVRHLNWHPNKNWLAQSTQAVRAKIYLWSASDHHQSDIVWLIGDCLAGIWEDVLRWSLTSDHGDDTASQSSWSSLPGAGGPRLSQLIISRLQYLVTAKYNNKTNWSQ